VLLSVVTAQLALLFLDLVQVCLWYFLNLQLFEVPVQLLVENMSSRVLFIRVYKQPWIVLKLLR